jgi:helix-turn-helix protein
MPTRSSISKAMRCFFATPRIPYHWTPADADQTGMFCIFTADFLTPQKAGVDLDELPIFQPGHTPVFQLDEEECNEVEYLNKVLKEATGSTTSELISRRLIEEARILLKQTNWSVAEIAYTLGFDEVSHFSAYFKKQTSVAPLTFRV